MLVITRGYHWLPLRCRTDRTGDRLTVICPSGVDSDMKCAGCNQFFGDLNMGLQVIDGDFSAAWVLYLCVFNYNYNV